MASRYWIGGDGNWSDTAHWSASSGGSGGESVPVAADNVFVNANSDVSSANFSINVDSSRTCNSLSISSVDVLVTISNTTNLTINGLTSVSASAANYGLKLTSNFSTGTSFTHTSGTFDFTDCVLTCGTFNSSNSNTRSIAFGTTGKIIVTGNNATVFSVSTNTNLTITGTASVEATYAGSTGTRVISTSIFSEALSFNLKVSAGTDIITVSNGTTQKNLDFTGFAGTLNNNTRTIYGNLIISSGMTCTAGTSATTFASTSGTKTITTNNQTLDFPIGFNGVGGTWEFSDALTQGSTRAFTITNGTVKLKAGATSTVGAFATSGSNQKYLQSTTAGSQATLSQASGTVTVRYLTIKDIAATGGATWNAYYDNGNIDAGNNVNWNFGGTPSYDTEYGYRLRSFTEQGRF